MRKRPTLSHPTGIKNALPNPHVKVVRFPFKCSLPSQSHTERAVVLLTASSTRNYISTDFYACGLFVARVELYLMPTEHTMILPPVWTLLNCNFALKTLTMYYYFILIYIIVLCEKTNFNLWGTGFQSPNARPSHFHLTLWRWDRLYSTITAHVPLGVVGIGPAAPGIFAWPVPYLAPTTYALSRIVGLGPATLRTAHARWFDQDCITTTHALFRIIGFGPTTLGLSIWHGWQCTLAALMRLGIVDLFPATRGPTTSWSAWHFITTTHVRVGIVGLGPTTLECTTCLLLYSTATAHVRSGIVYYGSAARGKDTWLLPPESTAANAPPCTWVVRPTCTRISTLQPIP